MLGFKVSQATVSRYMPPANRRPGQSWRTFVGNQAIAFSHTQSPDQDSASEFLSLRNRSNVGGDAVCRVERHTALLRGTLEALHSGAPPWARRRSARGTLVPITFQLKIRCEVRRIMRGHRHGRGIARAEPSHGSSFEKARPDLTEVDRVGEQFIERTAPSMRWQSSGQCTTDGARNISADGPTILAGPAAFPIRSG